MEIVKYKGFAIEPTGVKLTNGFTEEVARQVLDSVNTIDNCRQWVLGDWWNEVQKAGHNGRGLLREKDMLSEENIIKQYAGVANWCKVLDRSNTLSFTAHYECYKAGEQHRDQLLKEAIKGGWSKRRVIERASELKGKPKKIVVTETTIKKGQEAAAAQPHKAATAQEYAPTNSVPRSNGEPNFSEACEAFGFGGTLVWIAQDTIDILYRSLSMKAHPDQGGSNEAMSKLAKCKKILERIAR